MKNSINLQGSWQFLLDNEQEGIKNHFELKSFNDTIVLPTTTSEAKKGKPNEERCLGNLTQEYKTEGYAWYQKQISIEKEAVGKTAVLTLERTRISHVWVDGTYVGTNNSFCSAHTYHLTNYITNENPVLTIMTSNTGYLVGGGHMTSPDTQTNWNGILGKMSLDFYDQAYIQKVQTNSQYPEPSTEFSLQINASKEKELFVTIKPFILKYDNASADTVEQECEEKEITVSCLVNKGDNTIKIQYPFEHVKEWDEFEPTVYSFKISLLDKETNTALDEAVTYYGHKKFKADGTHFTINGTKTFLRGKHEGMIFPLTGYAPMNVAGWIRVMKISKDYGINHYRFHTCCPPEAAFIAADLLGIYLQPEVPFWGTFTAPGDEGHDETGQNFLIQEGFHILNSFASHPSFVMMSMGNELWGSPEAINKVVGGYKKEYPQIQFTQGSNNFQWMPNIQSNDDFFSGVRFTIDRQIRGSYAMCDKPLGHIQTDRPCTDFNYEKAVSPEYNSNAVKESEDGTVEIQYGTGVKRVKLVDVEGELVPNIPVVSHEIGQYETYPDFDEIDKYTGVLKARNFEIFRERLLEKGLLSMAKDYFKSSGKLAAACYKDELETAIRTKSLAGYQILDIQDFSGQGTALIGILDAFMDNKGIVTKEEWKNFCSDSVLQAEFPTYVYPSGNEFKADITFSYYGKMPISEAAVTYRILMDGIERECGRFVSDSDIESGVNHLGMISFIIPDVEKTEKLTLEIGLAHTDVKNHYELWIYPDRSLLTYEKIIQDGTVQIAENVEDAIEQSKAGRKVLLLLDKEHNPNAITGTYCTDFWNYPMFRSISESMKKEVPIGTMGLLIRKESPALQKFVSESYSTPQWWDIVMNSASTILDDTKIIPIVQTIDNFERNHRLGLLYEVRLKECKNSILICTSPLLSLSQERIEAAWLLESLIGYVKNNNIQTVYEMDTDSFEKLFRF